MKELIEPQILATVELPRLVGKWKAYELYKDSGVEWLEEVPAHWEVRRIKYLAPLVAKRLLDKPDNLPYIALEHIESGTGKLIQGIPIEHVESTINYFGKRNVLFGKLRPYLSKVVFTDFEGVCSTELLVFQPGYDIDGKYLYFRLISNDFIHLVTSFTYGTKMPRANSEQVCNIPIQVPSLQEQKAITAFLDRETAKINKLIAKKERMIELLQERRTAIISQAVTKGLNPDAPMKDSGVEWLGEIPAHWEVRRLKFIANVLSGIAKGGSLAEKKVVDLPYLRVANVQAGYLDLSDVATIPVGIDEVNRYLLKAGDILMNEGGDFDKLGRGFTWDGSVDPCLHQNHVFAVRPFSVNDSSWISIITQTSYAKHFFTTLANLG